MTRAPFVMGKATRRSRAGRGVRHHDRLAFPQPEDGRALPAVDSMPETAQNVADDSGVAGRPGRVRAPLARARRWAAANGTRPGDSPSELVPQGKGARAKARRAPPPRRDARGAGEAAPASLRQDGTVTAGNASGVNDGAAALIVASAEAAERLRRRAHRAHRRLRRGRRGPRVMGVGPIPAVRKLLRARWDWRVGQTSTSSNSTRRSPRRASRDSASSASTRSASIERRRDRDRPPARHERRPHHRRGRVRAQAARRPLRPRDDVCRRRPGRGAGDRARLTFALARAPEMAVAMPPAPA